jgi:membrane-associated protease RseP (regulator of RpoE activity)
VTGAAVVERAAPADEPVDPPAPSRTETALRLTALVVGTAAFVGFIYALGGIAWVAVILSIIAIITLHEMGHFVTAKWSGMKATEFFVGFGPRLWSIRRGETEYGVKALPLGGYVKILGMTSQEELDPSDEPRSFVNQSTSSRVLVASAGSIVHFALAFFLAICALFFIGQPHAGRTQIVKLSSFPGVAATPAQQAGLRVGDVVLTINGVTANSDNAADLIQSSAGQPMRIVVRRHGQPVVLTATAKHLDPSSSTYYLGISYVGLPAPLKHPGLLGSVTGAGSLIWQVGAGTVTTFAHAFSPAGLGTLANQVANTKAGTAAAASGGQSVSMIGATVLAADAFHAGALQFIGILIALNISLGVLNMLPMLPLDGGHVAIALYERARTRKGRARYRADVNKLMPVVYAFLAFLLVFVASKMYLDIAHGVANPFG